MCGIFCCISHRNIEINNDNNTKWCLFEENISRRGPDDLGQHSQVLNQQWQGDFAASVLWMQGPEPVHQPCVDEHENVLLWNGDIFDGPLASTSTSDTEMVLSTLKHSSNILKTICTIKGPYSFIYHQKSTNLLYFGRDPIGRHSLLIKTNSEHSSLVLTSVASKNILNIIELPAIGIFSMDLNSSSVNLTCHPWNNKRTDAFMTSLNNLKDKLGVNIDVKDSILTSETENDFVEPQVCDISFLKTVGTIFESNNIQVIMTSLLQDDQITERVNELLKLLRKSIEVRIRVMPRYCHDCINHRPEIQCDHSKIGILFSGGLDSTILARIADEIIPPCESIDLINVAFEKASVRSKKSTKPSNFDVPDRKTGRQALQELVSLSPHRKWNFIEVNITREELISQCSSHICNLVYPLRTILDESLGCAVWFASRGTGILSNNTQDIYTSPARVLLLGMGADELFGGYTRHRNTLRRSGWCALTTELNNELSRISERNLGRDDRIVSDHGRQSRLPFLDENFVKFVQSLRPWERCCPTENMPAGLGDKMLLRLAAWKIGLRETANFPKRAFQFGSRIANSKENAKDLSVWLK